ncbi:response regulator transcription factor [Kosmotoga pacifica]|uniref:Transcriptional regulator n=1 Tax=Kosmotoga pacifica TaxID=1330330 RepID=A0A0G2Z8Q0_9BACT|nr:response regulator transcription factor [Kosmotoga pacifica]AKI97970.1 transcriptional regulator [Kosmotoga pacifica]
MKILIVEDNERLAENIKAGFRAHGYLVDVATTGEAGLELALVTDYDVIVLDVMLPDISGFTFCASLREEKATPVLMLTALGDIDNKLKGFSVGADDYLPKPFDFRELLARVEALIRRNQPDKSGELRYLELKMDLKARELRFGDKPIKLSAREFGILELFMRYPGTVFSREQIINKVWESHYEPKSNIVDVYILYLRNKLKPFGYDRYLETVSRIGYRLKKPDGDNGAER